MSTWAWRFNGVVLDRHPPFALALLLEKNNKYAQAVFKYMPFDSCLLSAFAAGKYAKNHDKS